MSEALNEEEHLWRKENILLRKAKLTLRDIE